MSRERERERGRLLVLNSWLKYVRWLLKHDHHHSPSNRSFHPTLLLLRLFSFWLSLSFWPFPSNRTSCCLSDPKYFTISHFFLLLESLQIVCNFVYVTNVNTCILVMCMITSIVFSLATYINWEMNKKKKSCSHEYYVFSFLYIYFLFLLELQFHTTEKFWILSLPMVLMTSNGCVFLYVSYRFHVHEGSFAASAWWWWCQNEKKCGRKLGSKEKEIKREGKTNRKEKRMKSCESRYLNRP